MSACPQCGESSQVLKLDEFWRSLSQDAELKQTLAQPPAYVVRWAVVVVPVLLAVLAFSAGSVGWGVLLVLGAGVAVWWAAHRSQEAEDARERWTRLLYCRRCPARFLPQDALEA